jgi:hypothetical protein
MTMLLFSDFSTVEEMPLKALTKEEHYACRA